MSIDKPIAENATIKFTQQGAHIYSWLAGGEEQLFLSKKACFDRGVALRGGVPICFPQFGAFGTGQKHGFARNIDWNIIGADDRSARLQLNSSTETLKLWSSEFIATFTVSATGNTLEMIFDVANTQEAPIEFTAALHTYLRVADIEACSISGLKDVSYWNNGNDFSDRNIQDEKELEIHSAIDRVYFNTQEALRLNENNNIREIKSEGFRDTVIWNPWKEGATALSDMEDDEYRQMLCIESAAVETPIKIAPKQSWRGSQTITILDR